ncbi:MAG: MATE family efflux transporter [Aristaeellaceae bacterium]
MHIKRLNPFSDKVFLRRLTHLATPMVLQHLMLASVAVCDALMLGSVAQDSMSAVSLATQIQFVQNIIMSGMTSAVAVLASQYWGKGDRRTVEQVLAIGIRSCGLISLCFGVMCILMPDTLMRIFTNEDVLITLGAQYLRIAGWSYLLTGLSQPLMSVTKSIDHPKEVAVISSSTVALNILLNGTLIFGWFGLPAMEVEGAALATLICRIIELVWIFAVSRKPDFVGLRLRLLVRFNKVLSKDFCKCMLPLLGACLFWGIGFVSYSAFMGHMGTDAVAANSVASVVRDLVCCMCDGLAGGGGVLVGQELGAGHLTRARDWGDRLTVMAYIIGAVSALLMLACTPLVVQMVRLTDGASHFLSGMMAIMSFYMIGRAVNTVIINGIFAAGGDTLFDMYSLAVSMWCLAVPLAALGTFYFHWPVLLVYACTCLDEVGKIPWVMIHYRKYRWVKDLTRDFSGEQA